MSVPLIKRSFPGPWSYRHPGRGLPRWMEEQRVPVASGPPPPPPVPSPIAQFDFNKYTAFSPTIPNSVVGQPAANINEFSFNGFTSATNSYLTLYYNFFGQCGGITTPTYTFRTVELWFRYPAYGFFSATQYIMDARIGAGGGYWISYNTPGPETVGPDLINSKVYLNVNTNYVLSGSSPDTLNQIYGTGWTQLVLVLPADITDNVAFFIRYTGEQGVYYADVADVALYNTALTSGQVKSLFNSKCSRYGLSPIP